MLAMRSSPQAGSHFTRLISCSARARSVLAALGGAANVRQVEGAANRLLVALADAALIDVEALKRAGLRALARTAPDRAQLIFPEAAGPLAAAMAGLQNQ